MEGICTANFRWTREELVRAMQYHQRVTIRRGVVLLMKVFSAVLLLLISLLLVAGVLLPGTSAPPVWAVIVLAAFSLYWLTFDIVNAWYWSLGFNKRPDANIEINWRFSDAEITMQSSLGTATVGWNSFFRIVETSDGFLFYPLKKLFHWLPFAAFESADCIAKVRRLIVEKGY
jgi:YcxB-like protein